MESSRERTLRRLTRNARKGLLIPAVLMGIGAVAESVLVLSPSSEPDLFDLTPKSRGVEGYQFIAWYELQRAARALKVGEPFEGSSVRVLGYATGGDQALRRGREINHFLLLPDVSGMHHDQFGDQMIEVRLRIGEGAQLVEGSLVWASGTWRSLPGDPNQDKPLYLLENARVEHGLKSQIEKYFQ